MAAQIGADDLDLLGDPRPEFLTDVARVQPESGREWVDLEKRLGFRSTQRLWISDVPDGVLVATWPAELARQARYLYGGGLGSALVAAAIERGWTVEPSPHIAWPTSPPGRRLYMHPSVARLDYVACWEDEDGLHRVTNYSREDVEHQLWPWLKQKGFADDGDDAVLLRFLDELPGNWPAQMRPGLRFRRVWTPAEAAELGSALAETIRSDFDAVFAVVGEPMLSELTDQRTAGPGLGAPYRQVPVTELSGSREPFSVDPELVERGLRGHSDTQNELASVLSNAGIEPRRGLAVPGPNFDLAWQKNETVFVAEVKSITADNEEAQLRLGLGQVLRYRQRLLALGHDRVVAVLVPERQPRDSSWRDLCQDLGVVLLCRNEFERAPALDMR